MEFKGTKGKWHFDKEKAKVFKDDGNTLCVCYYSNIINKEECEPNALLISKAPEMLNKLIYVIDTLKGFDSNNPTERMIIEECEQIIKEATQI
jgi:hypothetical protein